MLVVMELPVPVVVPVVAMVATVEILLLYHLLPVIPAMLVVLARLEV
jgi:hypothetical protein